MIVVAGNSQSLTMCDKTVGMVSQQSAKCCHNVCVFT